MMNREAYIYLYVNRNTHKTYIGSRSRYKTTAAEDFNIKYKSSSKDTEFLSDMEAGLLDGFIFMIIKGEDAGKSAVQIEHSLIQAFWNKYGKENSYNRYCNGEFSMVGRKHSIETKEKWSQERRGENNPCYGKTLSEERKAYLRTFRGEKASMYGKHQSPETCKKKSEALKNRKVSEETRKKLREANTGKTHTEEVRRRISEAQRGKTLSQETKDKIRASKIGEKNYLYGKHLSDEHKKALSRSLTGKKRTEDTKRLISEKLKGRTVKLYLFRDELGNEHIMNRSNKNRWHPTWIEIKEVDK